MSERKGINRYYPPDVDPSKVKFGQKQSKKSEDGRPKAQSIRAMAPFSMKCLKCNEYIAQSRKFNMRKEVTDRDYLGIKILRFSARCPRCYGELVFETDPKNGDYQCVSGCKKNYERPAEVKNNESIDEMIARIDKEVKEDERMKELERKGGKRNGTIGEETGMEQLEKRLVEQQKEKERVEELEELQQHMQDLENKRMKFYDEKTTPKEEEDDNLDIEAKKAFDEYKKQPKQSTPSLGLMNGYSDDSDSDSDEEEDKKEPVEPKPINKRPLDSVRGIIKRKKPKVIT